MAILVGPRKELWLGNRKSTRPAIGSGRARVQMSRSQCLPLVLGLDDEAAAQNQAAVDLFVIAYKNVAWSKAMMTNLEGLLTAKYFIE